MTEPRENHSDDGNAQDCTVVRPCANLSHARADADRYRRIAGRLLAKLRDVIAASWATIGAIRDGETEPWRYLTDEIPSPPDDHPLAHLWRPVDEPAAPEPE